MSLNVKLWFGSANIKEIELQMPCLPQTGNNVVFPKGFVKDANGIPIPQTTFKVLSVDFILNDILQTRIELNVQAIY